MVQITRDEIIEELTDSQRTLAENVRVAGLNLDAAVEGYGRSIDKAKLAGLSYRVLERFTGRTYTSLFRQHGRWLSRLAGKTPRQGTGLVG